MGSLRRWKFLLFGQKIRLGARLVQCLPWFSRFSYCEV